MRGESMDAAITLVCLALAVYTFRPRRRHMAPRTAVRPAVASRPRRSSPPLLPLLAGLLAQSAARVKLLSVEAWRAACMEWQRVHAGNNAVSSWQMVDQKPQQKITTIDAPLASVSGIGIESGYGIEAGIDTEPDIKMTKGRVTAIEKWKAGQPLTQSDMAALLGGRRAAAMAAIVATIEREGAQDG